MNAAPIRLAVLGDPLRYTRSPELHQAGFRSLGLAAESRALPTPPETLGARLAELAREGLLGVNLTAPLKETALAHLPRLSEASARSRSVNTIGFAPDGWWGDTTDGAGFVALLGSFGLRARDQRVVLMGAGGSARSLGHALIEAGCDALVVSARDPERAAESWREIPGARFVAWRTQADRLALAQASVVVNATPIADARELVDPEDLDPRALAIDLRYERQPTQWVRLARAAGRQAYDGLGLLVFQARGSLSLWTGREVAIDPLARAVGWPR